MICGGSSIATTIATKSTFAPRNRRRARAYAAGTELSSMNAVARIA